MTLDLRGFLGLGESSRLIVACDLLRVDESDWRGMVVGEASVELAGPEVVELAD